MSNPVPAWIEAMRLRTLPVSVAGVLTGWALAIEAGAFRPVPALVCLAFAVLAQISSNFANEYFDYKDGIDSDGRDGPRRGVTEGDISPRAMLLAALSTVGVACALGCTLLFYGSLWLLPAGVLIALGAFAYSAGPYPLSRHCLGEVAVLIFFGLVPVCLTFYVQAGFISPGSVRAGLGMGLLGAMVLLCNNYRDIDSDRRVGKHTLSSVFGRRVSAMLFLLLGIGAGVLLSGWYLLPCGLLGAAGAWLMFRAQTDASLRRGVVFTRLLAATSMVMFSLALAMCVMALL